MVGTGCDAENPPLRLARSFAASVRPASVPISRHQDGKGQPDAREEAPSAPALTPLQQRSLGRLLPQVQQQLPGMTWDRLVSLLRDPESGWCGDLSRFSALKEAVVAYVALEAARPGGFPDADFFMAFYQSGLPFYSVGNRPEGEAFDDWVQECDRQMKAARIARHAMVQWEPALQAFMPEKPRFQEYINSRRQDAAARQKASLVQAMAQPSPAMEGGPALPDCLLRSYRHNLKAELFVQMRVFGPDSINRHALEHIFVDCCENLLSKFPDYDRGLAIWRQQDFDWQESTRHSYRPRRMADFLGYEDADVLAASEGRTAADQKFRISVHPHDYEKAWPLVAERLCRKRCPFPVWKSPVPSHRGVGMECDERFDTGGQFTLYCLPPQEGCVPPRFQEANIADTLRQIEDVLRQHSIRPGQLPCSDVSYGERHPYVSYRFQNDRTRQKYEPAAHVSHQRRRDYMQEPLYQAVGSLLG